MDVALFANSFLDYLPPKYDIYQWLSMIHGKSTKSRLNGLKRKSLILNLEEEHMGIGIHDLWREFCVMETKIGDLKSRRWIYERLNGSNDPSTREPSLYTGIWKRVERVSMTGPFMGTCNVNLNLSRCSSLIALDLVDVNVEGNALDLSGACNLKSLRVSTSSICKVHGLGLLRHLCLLNWVGILPINMEFIEEIEGLTNLQILNIENHFGNIIKVPNLSNLSLLQCVAFYGLDEGNSITCTSVMTNLQHLCLQNCESLQRCNGVGDLVALEELLIFECRNLEELPNLRGLKNLKKLDILGCSSIQALLGVGDLATLLELRVVGCTNLGELPDLSKLTNLQFLDLGMCLMNKVVMGLSVLVNLQNCSIPVNGLGEFNDLHKLTKLQSINVEGWNLQGSLGVDSLVNLKHLMISYCQGVDILDGPSKVSRLCTIDISDCEFKNVACLSNFIALREVSISGCLLLERFPDMHKATGLETLYISNCKNLRVWEGLTRMRVVSSGALGVHLQSGGTFSNLQVLFLSELAITELPDLSDFPQLIRLSIHECPSLVRLTSNVPLNGLQELFIIMCESLTTIPNLNGCKHLTRVRLWMSGVKLSTHEIENLRTMCPTIQIDQ